MCLWFSYNSVLRSPELPQPGVCSTKLEKDCNKAKINSGLKLYIQILNVNTVIRVGDKILEMLSTLTVDIALIIVPGFHREALHFIAVVLNFGCT